MDNREIESLDSLKELPEELLRNGLKVRVRVSGNSMFPRLRNGNLVQIDPPGSLPLKRGMVVCVLLHDAYVLHRILKVPDDQFVITRADFYPQPDQPVPRDKVCGVAVRRWKGGKAHGKGQRIREVSPLWISILMPFSRGIFRLLNKSAKI